MHLVRTVIALRFKPDDFHLKSVFGVGVDWPIDYAALERWFAQAEVAIGVAGPADDDLGAPRRSQYPLPPIPLSTLDRAFAGAPEGTPYTFSATSVARNSVPYDG